jgi:hypothetical protein
MHDKAMENHQATTNALSEQSKSISQKIKLQLNTTADSMAALSLKDDNSSYNEPKSTKGIYLFLSC